ncbi:MAG: CoA transferase subunit A [Acidobacteria bacterium]|nr:CoA transferase subunit A [Acidobacteriota bacterium]
MIKLTNLSEAVGSISSGSHVALSGFAITRCAMAFAREVIRQRIDGLTVSQCVGAMDADLLAGAGCVKRVIYGGGALDRFGRLACINAGIENGSIIAEEYSSLSIAFRYLAASLGLPFIPIRSLAGSDLLARIQEKNGTDVAFINDPFTGDQWLTLKPLIPDVAVVQVQVSDEEGNCWIMGPKWDNAEQARAAKQTIIIAEHIVSSDVIRREPERCVIPNLLVSHVVSLPFSAHPTSVYREYDYDAEEIKRYVEATKNPQEFGSFLDKYVYGVKDHWEYLDRIGGLRRLKTLRADPILGY